MAVTRVGSHWKRAAGAVVLVLLSVGLGRVAGDEFFTKSDADSMSQKIKAIVAHGELTKRPAKLTPITEREVNAYLKFGLSDTLPPGVMSPNVTILGAGRLSAKAVVDLDVVKRRRQSAGGWFDPLALLSGRVPVGAVGTLQAQQGMARFELESADVSGVPVPKALLQELLNVYARTPERPDGINLDAPFPLPAKIVEIRVAEQRAVIVQ